MDKFHEEEKLKAIMSERILVLLQHRDMTQRDLANILGIDKSTVGKWVTGKAIPRLGYLQIMANHFNVPMSYLLTDDNPINGDAQDILNYLHYNPEANALLSKSRQLTREQLQSLIALIDSLHKE